MRVLRDDEDYGITALEVRLGRLVKGLAVSVYHRFVFLKCSPVVFTSGFFFFNRWVVWR